MTPRRIMCLLPVILWLSCNQEPSKDHVSGPEEIEPTMLGQFWISELTLLGGDVPQYLGGSYAYFADPVAFRQKQGFFKQCGQSTVDIGEGCVLTTEFPRQCDGECGLPAWCVWTEECGTTCIVEPPSLSVGELTVTGTHLDPITYSNLLPNENSTYSGYAADKDIDSKLWDADSIVISASGDAFPGFDQSFEVPAPVEFITDLSQLSIDNFLGDSDLTLQWVPDGTEDKLRVKIGFGGEKTTIDCETPDDGSLTIAAEHIAELNLAAELEINPFTILPITIARDRISVIRQGQEAPVSVTLATEMALLVMPEFE